MLATTCAHYYTLLLCHSLLNLQSQSQSWRVFDTVEYPSLGILMPQTNQHKPRCRSNHTLIQNFMLSNDTYIIIFSAGWEHKGTSPAVLWTWFVGCKDHWTAQGTLWYRQLWIEVCWTFNVVELVSNNWLHSYSVVTIWRLRKKWGILSTQQQKHTPESIYNNVYEIRKRFPLHGIEGIQKSLQIEHGIHAPW